MRIGLISLRSDSVITSKSFGTYAVSILGNHTNLYKILLSWMSSNLIRQKIK